MKYFFFLDLKKNKPFWFVARKAKQPEISVYQIKFDDIFLSSAPNDLKLKLIDCAADFWGEDRNDPDMFVFDRNSGWIDYFSSDTVNHGLITFIFLVSNYI